MSHRPHGRARVDPSNPSAFGVCDRCYLLYNLVDLRYQYEWRGPRLANTGLRVCWICMDKPCIFLRPVTLPPDPVPVIDPRPEFFDAEMGPEPPLPDYLLDDDGNILLNDAGERILRDGSPTPLQNWV